MAEKAQLSPSEAGKRSYEEWRNELHSDPEYQRIYAEEAAKSELWLQLVEARQEAGLTQAQIAERLGVTQSQVARIEKRGYETYTLTTLRRYVAALGEGYSLEVHVHTPTDHSENLQDHSSRHSRFASA